MILIAMLAVPFAGALLMLVNLKNAAVIGTAISAVTLGLAVAAAAGFDYDTPRRMQLGVNVPWAAAIKLRFHLGIDGISLPLIVLTALLTLLCMYLRAADGTVQRRPSSGLLLLLEVGIARHVRRARPAAVLPVLRGRPASRCTS